MSSRYDSIIIGGGHNGLVCAAYLAKAGRRVLVLEAADQLGGAAITRPFADGFRVSACAHLLHMLPRETVKDLALEKHGLVVAGMRMPSHALSPDGQHLHFTEQGLAGASAADSEAYGRFRAQMARFASHLRPIMNMVPPRLGTRDWNDHAKLLRLGWQIRSLGRADMRELLRILGMNVYDLLEDHFVSPSVCGALGFDAVLGSNFGPRSPGSVLTLLYRLAGESGAVPMAQPAGGIGAVTAAIAESARAFGAELRTGTPVARIVVRDDSACGVMLDTGEIIEAASVISNADPRTTFLKLLGAEHLDTGFVRRITHFRSKGLTAKLHIALTGVPQFTGLDPRDLMGRLIVSPSLDYLENAFNPTKYGEASAAPALEILCPTATDPALAPPGQHVLSVIAQYAPHAPLEGWDNLRGPFTERIIDAIAAHAPGLRHQIIATELLTPADIESQFRIAGGHWHHGELAFDQFFFTRPVPGAAQHRAPVSGLFLCGAGAHPGGGVMGVAGRNAAQAVLSHKERERVAA